jgi:carbamoylphosphate synthase large subunit
LQQILFAPKDDWIAPVRERLDAARFQPTFQEFPDADLAAFDCIVPLRLKDYAALRGKSAKFLIPNRQAVDITDDKQRFNAWLKLGGFEDLVPDVYDESDVFPMIYKKRHDDAGKNSKVIFSAAERDAFEQTINAKDYFKQRYVGGRNEYTTHFLSVNGSVRFDTSVEFAFDRDHYVRGVQADSQSITKIDTPFATTFAAILEALDYTGTCCFNYKIENGKPLIFEINPRCGGSLRLDLNNYLDAYLTALAART